MKLDKLTVCTVAVFVLAAAVTVVFSLGWVQLSADECADALIKAVIPRLAIGIAAVFAALLLGYKSALLPVRGRSAEKLLWCLPCLFVALANFPFTALIGGAAVIERADLLPLFILKCLSIGIMEEIIFRGILQPALLKKLSGRKYGTLLSVAATSAVFGLWHLLNLIDGAGIGATLMQVGYSFLIGGMLSAVVIKTGSVWPCILLHALFDCGGFIVTDLGSGAFQDVYFWIFTAVAAAICLIHVLNFLLKADLPVTPADPDRNENDPSS